MTATLSPSGPPPLVVRIRPAPSFEPPADDVRHPDDHPGCAGQMTLFASLYAEVDEPVGRRAAHRSAAPGRSQWTRPAAAATVAAGPVPRAGSAPAAGSVPRAASAPAAGPVPRAASAPAAGPVPRAGSAPPGGPFTPAERGAGRRPGAGGGPPTTVDPHAAASRFVGVCVEILNGFRPVAHLRSLTTPFDYASVTRQLTRRAMRIRMPARRPRGAEDQVGLLCLRVCELRDGVAEAAAVLHVGGASWAVALRFEQRRGAWLCTLLQVV
jgi:hypothetical protein